MLFYDSVEIVQNSLDIVLVARVGVSRSYDDVVNYVMRELEIRPIYGHPSSKFSRIHFESVSRNEMPQMSISI